MIITSDTHYQHDQIKCDDMGQDVRHGVEEDDKYTKFLVENKPKERDIQKHSWECSTGS